MGAADFRNRIARLRDDLRDESADGEPPTWVDGYASFWGDEDDAAGQGARVGPKNPRGEPVGV